VHRIDTLGFDAIDFGTIASWVLECLDNGLLKSTDFMLDVETTFDPKKFLEKPGEYSYKNALFIRHLAYMVVAREGIGDAVAEGIRLGAKKLDKVFRKRLKGKSFKDYAVYLSQGKKGSLAPSQYWAPGLFAPIPLPHLSKTYYKMDVWDPVELGKDIAERYIIELGTDELGTCRFHRGWSEKVGGDLIMEVAGVDLEAHSKDIAKRILSYNKRAGVNPEFWETKRTKDIMYNYLIDFNKTSPNKNLANWVHRFGNSLDSNARKYWEKIKDSFESTVNS
jgi:glyceraldehyde-3-phosphate dehydrogenase (ferredoxin)